LEIEKSRAADPLRERSRALGIDVGHADELAIAARGEFLRVVAAHMARAQDRDFQ